MSHPLRHEIVLVSRVPEPILNVLEGQGFRVLPVDDCSSALQVCKGHPFDTVLVAMDCSHQKEFLRRLRESDPALQLLVLAEDKPLDVAIEDVGVERIPNSTPLSELSPVICRAIELTRLRRENQQLKKQLVLLAPTSNVAAESAAADASNEVGRSVGVNADLASVTSAHVRFVLAQCKGNKAQTARALGINRRSLYRLLEKYGQ